MAAYGGAPGQYGLDRAAMDSNMAQMDGAEDDEFGTLQHQLDILSTNNPVDYVNHVIQYAEDLFRQDRGRQDTKRANLGDIRSTRIRTPDVLQ